ncbi:MAG: N-acetylneuraminate synthase family protein [Candidatus Omnitrophota bacterium]|jgi:sialic acid synthase SpsE
MTGKVIIIAEVGECWNGDRKQAQKLIQVAASAGCDYVKFQTLDTDTVKDNDPEKEWFLKVALTEEMIDFIIKFSKKNSIKPLFTPANLKKAMMLKDGFKLSEVKIASSVAHDSQTVRYAAKNFKRVFLSTGLSSLEEIKNMVRFFDKNKRTQLYLLHCISEYPTGPLLKKRGLLPLAPEDVHLNMMLMLKELFPQYGIGYSDHTVSILPSICAVAAGAKVIEKHITLDRNKPAKLFKNKTGYLGTDHVLSLEPSELRNMVGQIRQVEKILGPEKWERTSGEKMLKKFLIGRF